MSVETLVKQIDAAFADVPWLYGETPSPFTPESAAKALEDIFLTTDGVKKYELPRMLCVAVTRAEPPLRERLLCRLIEFLDVDFHDPQMTNEPLKEARRKTFSSYSNAQSLVIWNWLTFVKVSYELRDCHEELTSAIRYWGQRARSHSGKTTQKN